jgi:uncharacterized protein DUF6285
LIPVAGPPMRDLPTGPALLALARDVLLRDLMPLLPQAAHLDARLVANSMAIAEREAMSGERSAQGMLRELERLYGDDVTLTHPARRAESPLPRIAGEGHERSDADEAEEALLRRFAQDLRGGLFEEGQPRERHAREILWRLTISKLRQANPRFLDVNGFS